MKKFLLLFSSLMLAFSASAFTDYFWQGQNWPSKLTTSSGAGSATSTNGVVYTYSANVYQSGTTEGGGYLMFRYGDSNYLDVKPNIDCDAIKVQLNPNGNPSTGGKLQLFVDGTAITEVIPLDTKGGWFTFNIPADKRTSGTTYRFKATNKNVQLYAMEFIAATTGTSLKLADDATVEFATPLHGSQTKTITLLGQELAEDITVSCSSPAFIVSKTTISMDDEVLSVDVTYVGNTAGEVNGTITFDSDDQSVDATVHAITVPHAGTETDPLTPEDVMALNNLNVGPYYVRGTIADNIPANNGALETDASKIADTSIAFITTTENVYVPVALPYAAENCVRDILGIKTNPGVIGQTVIVKGTLEKYFLFTGVKNTEYVSGLGFIKQAAGLNFATKEFSVSVGDPFTAPTLENPNSLPVTYSTDNTTAVSVDATTGAVTILSAGTAVITASSEETDEFLEGSASYTIHIEGTYTLPFNETFATSLSDFTIDDIDVPEGKSVWSHSEYKGTTFAKATGYFSGANNAVDSWLISPTISLATAEEPVLTFSHAMRYFADLETAATECTVAVRIKGSDWETVNYNLPPDNNFTFGESGEISLEEYKGFSIEVGFHYTSTTTAAGTWEVANINIVDAQAGIEGIEADELESNAPVEYYNLQGVKIDSDNMMPGIYVRRQGSKASKVYMGK